jgi:hypothetical protein
MEPMCACVSHRARCTMRRAGHAAAPTRGMPTPGAMAAASACWHGGGLPAPMHGNFGAMAVQSSATAADSSWGALPAPMQGNFGAMAVQSPATAADSSWGALPAPMQGNFGAMAVPSPATAADSSWGALPAPMQGNFGAMVVPSPATAADSSLGALPAPAQGTFGASAAQRTATAVGGSGVYVSHRMKVHVGHHAALRLGHEACGGAQSVCGGSETHQRAGPIHVLAGRGSSGNAATSSTSFAGGNGDCSLQPIMGQLIRAEGQGLPTTWCTTQTAPPPAASHAAELASELPRVSSLSND